MLFIGIDPGLTGAMAIISSKGGVKEIKDCPVFEKMKSGERTTYDVARMLNSLYEYKSFGYPITTILEQLQPMPGNGAISNYSSGLGFGLWRMAITSCDYSCILISPRKWKKAMGLTASKDDSRQRAIELFPAAANQLNLKKHHGRAEALLLAEYGRRTYQGESI